MDSKKRDSEEARRRRQTWSVIVGILILVGLTSLFYFTYQFLVRELDPARTHDYGEVQDSDGCLILDGYSFDDRVGACTRGWELTDDIAAAAKLAVEEVGAGYGLTVASFNSYEEAGAYDITLECDPSSRSSTCFAKSGLAALEGVESHYWVKVIIRDWKVVAKEEGIE